LSPAIEEILPSQTNTLLKARARIHAVLEDHLILNSKKKEKKNEEKKKNKKSMKVKNEELRLNIHDHRHWAGC